jgi:hypothetical protein
METTVVELVVASNIDHMRELESASLQEITKSSNSLQLATKVSQCSIAVGTKVSSVMVVKIL